MDGYLEAVQKPEVVIGIAAAIAMIFLQPVFERIRQLIVKIVMSSPRWVRQSVRSIKARYLITLKKQRRNDAEIMFQVVRLHSFFILFMGSIAFYLAMLALGPLQGIGKLPLPVQYFIEAPIYIFEVLWLVQLSKVRDLIKARGRLQL